MRLARLGVADVERWHARLRRAGAGEGSIRNQDQALRAALTLAMRWGWISSNPAAVARLGKRKSSVRGSLSSNDVRRAMEGAATFDPGTAVAPRQTPFLDALFVSRDARGLLGPGHDSADLDVSSDPPGSTLWQLLNGNGLGTSPPTPLELHSSGEVGLDLAAVESLAYQIEPGTSALLILVETRWATDLLEVVITSGGFPIVSGCLEPETMLVVGPQLATAAEAGETAEVLAAAQGVASLDALGATPEPAATVAADVIRALV
jgi:hypothetical protein